MDVTGEVTRGKDGATVVLAAVDGSRTSLRACAYAAGVARRQRARLVIVYVQPAATGTIVADYTGAGLMIPPPVPSDPADLRREALAVASDLQDAAFVVRTGDPCDQIVREARAAGAEVLILGAPESLLHRWMGSLASRLVRANICPVTVVP
jgi:nucleotide-binding universal stress UspA family protein